MIPRVVPACLVAAACLGAAPAGQTQARRMESDLGAAIEQLGDFAHTVRVDAARVVRRAPAELAVPMLLEVARRHPDSYVQFRAAVLASGFGGSRVAAFFRDALDAANDRVRAAAYAYAEHAPDPALVPRLLAAAEQEASEFVRPALVRALAAHDDDAAVRRLLVLDVDRGQASFRSTVIEALGDCRANYAVDSLLRVARQPGPLQDDALLALGKIGDPRAMPAMQAAQAELPDDLQPIVSAAACLLGVDCERQQPYIASILQFGATTGTDRDRLRSAAAAAAALAQGGRSDALDALFTAGAGTSADDPARAPIALAIGAVALRRPEALLAALAARDDLDAALVLVRDAFDMLNEDLAEERFYVALRSAYAVPAAGAARRDIAARAVSILEF